MNGALARAGAALALVAALAGCSGDTSAEPAPSPSAAPSDVSSETAPSETAPSETAPSDAAPSDAAPSDAASGDAAICAEFAGAERSAFRQAVEAAERMPVLPAAIALIGLGPREAASSAAAQDPELAAAQAEVVAALDDLAAQSETLLGPEGNGAQDAVQLDVTRMLTALDEIERICAS